MRRDLLLGGTTALMPGTALAWSHGKGNPSTLAAPTFNLATPVTLPKTVGVVSATGNPFQWAITAGDPSGNFQIDDTGTITVSNAGATNLSNPCPRNERRSSQQVSCFALTRGVCDMGIHFIVYPPEDLARLDHQKKIKLKTAIMHVLHNDAQIRQMIKEKTQATYDTLARS